jgi:hypothetical protein
MKKIKVKDKAHIRQLLYAEFVLGVKGDQYRSIWAVLSVRDWPERTMQNDHSHLYCIG